MAVAAAGVKNLLTAKGRFQLGQLCLYERCDALTQLGRHQSLGGSQKKIILQGAAKFGQCMAGRWLRERQDLSGSGDRAGPVQGDQNTQQIEVELSKVH